MLRCRNVKMWKCVHFESGDLELCTCGDLEL